MKQQEYTDIYAHIAGPTAETILHGDSPEETDRMRKKSAVYSARVGFELAQARTYIRKQYLAMRARKESVATAEKQAEQDYDDGRGKEVEYYALKYLYEALDKNQNACAPMAKLIERKV